MLPSLPASLQGKKVETLSLPSGATHARDRDALPAGACTNTCGRQVARKERWGLPAGSPCPGHSQGLHSLHPSHCSGLPPLPVAAVTITTNLVALNNMHLLC